MDSRHHLVISVMARDRVGIIADVATVIKRLDGNLEDMSQTVLCGHFTMILVAAFPDSVTPETLRAALAEASANEPFEVGIRRMTHVPSAAGGGTSADERKYVLTAVGPDQIGLVAGVTEYLRQKDINVEDLATRVDAGQYTMILLLNLPPAIDVRRLKHSLQVAMSDVGVRVELQHQRIFQAANEI